MSFMMLAAAALAQAEPAEDPGRIPVPEGPRAEALDAEYGKRHYSTLTRLLFEPGSQEDLLTGLDWLGIKFRTDGSTYISYAYSNMLQAVAENLSEGDASQLRGTALSALAQAVLTARIDGQQCDDVSARGAKAEQMLAVLSASPLRELDEDERRMAALIVLHNENATWQSRQLSDQSGYLCRDGMQAIMEGMLRGSMAEREPRAGEVGRQIEITTPDDRVYPRRENSDWIGDAEKARATREDMLKLILGIQSIPSMEEIGNLISSGRE